MTDISSSQTLAAEGAGPRIVVGAFDDVALEKATRRAVTRALSEDLGGRGDLTSRATVPASLLGEGEVIAREAGVVSGLAAMVDAFTAVDARTTVELHVDAGQPVIEDQVIATVKGPVRGILAAERTALNFLGHLSGIASATARLQALVADTGCQVRDTRKTTPGLRLLEKAAVRDGGGGNHRIGLHDAILVKDNHILAAGGVAAAVRALREKAPDVAVQVEVEDVDQLRELLDLGVTDILLDNFTVDEVRHAVSRVDGRASLEVSGNLDEHSIRAYAEALGEGGRLAVGAITHSAPQLDVALDMVATENRAVTRPAAFVPASTQSASTEPTAADPATLPPPTSEPVSEVVDVTDEAVVPTTTPDVEAAGTAADDQSGGTGLWDVAATEEPDTDTDTAADAAATDDDAADDVEDRDATAEPAAEDSPVVVVEPPKRRRISSFFASDKDDTDTELEAVTAPEPSSATTPEVPSAPESAADLSVDAALDPPVEAIATAAPEDVEEAVATQDAEAATSRDAEAATSQDAAPSIDEAAIADAEVEGEPFSWRQSPFRQRRNRD